MPSLKDKTVLIGGRGSGIARAIAMAVSEDGGRVVVAGRHPDDLAAALADRIAVVDHVVCTASARARSTSSERRVCTHDRDDQ